MLGEEFYREANAPGQFSADSFSAAWAGLMEGNIGAIHVVRRGETITAALGGVCIADFNTGDLVALEMFWFASAVNRTIENLRLVRHFEEWARSRGASRCCMVHLQAINAERLERWYRKTGYEPLETYYWKTLGDR